MFLNNIENMTTEHDLAEKNGRIAYVIEHSGHNPASMAKLLGCKPSAIYQWLSGSTKNIKEDLLWRLADITGFEARWISQGSGPRRVPIEIKHADSVLMAMEPEARYKAVRLIDTFAEPEKNNGTQ